MKKKDKASRMFAVMVVGDNPSGIMAKYDMSLQCEEFVKYRYCDAKKIHDNAIKVETALIDKAPELQLNDFQIDGLKDNLKKIKNLSDFEFYQMVVQGLAIDDNGNAVSTENVNGKWLTCNIGKNFSTPLLLKTGKEVYSAKVKDVDWENMRIANRKAYNRVWEIAVEKVKPETEEDTRILETMGTAANYFAKFNSKEDYVNYSTSLWYYAFVDDTKWEDLNDGKTDMEWITGFYDNYIAKLDGEAQVTIMECSVK